MHGRIYEKEKFPVVSDIKESRTMATIYSLITGFGIGVLTTLLWRWRLSRTAQTYKTRANSSYKMVLVVRNDLGMGKGKIAAQCSHATLGCYKIAKSRTPQVLKLWEGIGQPKIVLKLDTPGEEGLYKLMEEAAKRGIASTVIRDAGHTQIERGTATVTGIGPHEIESIDEITGHLKLL